METTSSVIKPAATRGASWHLALKDLMDSLRNWRIWGLLAWQDIRLRYRRSQLGPFWITLSMAITIFSMALIYARLFHTDIADYLPFLATGMLTWNLLLSLVTESTNTFIEAEQYIKQIKLPMCTYVFRTVCRSIIIFGHNAVIMIPLFLWLRIPCTWAVVFVLPGLFLIGVNACCYGLILASLGARYRDVLQIITSLMQVVFFVTPIMWKTDLIVGRYLLWIKLNPFAHFVNLLRSPLMSQMPNPFSLTFVMIFTLMGIGLALFCLKRVRHRIVYWV